MRQTHIVSGFLLVFALVGLVLSEAPSARQTVTAGSATIVSPSEGEYVSGLVPLKVRVNSAVLPRSTNFFADGKLVCTVEVPPWECQWDAGSHVDEHTIRAVVALSDGARLVSTVRTKSAGYSEAVDVDAVLVTATVVDEDNHFVPGLTKSAFKISEDGVPQEIATFASENIPLELIVAVDMSGSMTEAMPQVKESVKHFLSALRPVDQVTLIAFNDNLFTLARPQADLATRLKAVDRLRPWGGTSLYDVILTSTEMLGRRLGRRALIIFSDGDDETSKVSLQTAEHRVEASDATVYTIGQGHAVKQDKLKKILERLASKSGGRAFFTENTDKLDAIFASIVEELSHQYLLGYAPKGTTGDDRWRQIKVELPGRTMKVRARQGYRTLPKSK
jgi:Ca-activated chloride channel homolog